MSLKATIVGAIACSALLFALGAQAKILDLTFTSADGDGSVRLVTIQRGTEHFVESATGTIDGSAASLVAPGGFASNDNIIFSTSPRLDFSGVSFLANGVDYNLYYDNGTFVMPPGYAICTLCGGGNETLLTSFSLTTVPEPATWAMLLAGLLGAGAIVRYARRRTIMAAQ